MAYSSRFNPDALPAHAEPNEAAQIIANAQAAAVQRTSPKTSPSPNIQPTTDPNAAYQTKPPPPLPNAAVQSSYRKHSGSLASPGIPLSPSFRPHAGSVPTQSVQQPSPPGNSSAWSTPLNTASHIPGSYPHSGGPLSAEPRMTSPVPPAGQRPHSPLPPAGTNDPSLWPLFMAVDTKRSGQLGLAELSSALKNDEYTSFDLETVRMMIKMFDGNGSGTIGYEEFCGLWGFLGAWRALFIRFDEDRSGFISYSEYSKALVAFGYSLSSGFIAMMYRLYDRRSDESMTFDLFVQSCIQLKRMTDVFKKYDTDRDGYITLSFEDFLTEILSTR